MSDDTQYAWIKYGCECEQCGEHMQGYAEAIFDGVADWEGEEYNLYRFTTPALCSNGHKMEYYIARREADDEAQEHTAQKQPQRKQRQHVQRNQFTGNVTINVYNAPVQIFNAPQLPDIEPMRRVKALLPSEADRCITPEQMDQDHQDLVDYLDGLAGPGSAFINPHGFD